MLNGPLAPAGTSSENSCSLPAAPDRPVTGTLLVIGVASGAQSTSHGSSNALSSAAFTSRMPEPMGWLAGGATANGRAGMGSAHGRPGVAPDHAGSGRKRPESCRVGKEPESAGPTARVAGDAQPRRISGPLARRPAEIDRAQGTFRVRHQDGRASVGAGQARDRVGGTV